MVITRSQGSLFLMAIVALSVIARTGLIADLLLLTIAGYMFLSSMLAPRLPERVRWILLAYILLFLLYLMLTLIDPSRGGIVNIIGIWVTGVMFIYFTQNAQRLVAARSTALILLGIGLFVCLAGTALGAVNKNTISGIVAYFFLSAGVIWVMRGVPLRRVSMLTFGLLLFLGLFLGHRLMLAASVIFLLVTFVMYSLPLRFLRTLLLGAIAGGIFGMIVLYSGLWGFDIRDFDALFIEYTGRTARSGRQIIWPAIIAFTAESPWFGLGTGATFTRLYNFNLQVEWSAHSYFLQIYLQTGLVGLSTLLFVLFTVWAAIGRPQRSQPIRIYMTACIVVLLLHVAFEVFLMQVNLFMGCCAWMMLGLGIGCIRAIPAPPPSIFSKARPHASPLSYRMRS